MNRAILIGNLTADPVIRYADNGTRIARFTLAVARQKKGETDFIGCIAFNKTAELIEKYVRKGSKLGVEGRIQTGSYEKDGKKVFTTDIVVDSVEFCSSKGTDDTPKTENASTGIVEGFMDIPDGAEQEGLPFR